MNIAEIKYCGKRVENGEWVMVIYGKGLIDVKGDEETYRHFIMVWDINGYFRDYVVDPATLKECVEEGGYGASLQREFDKLQQENERYKAGLDEIAGLDCGLDVYPHVRIAKETLKPL